MASDAEEGYVVIVVTRVQQLRACSHLTVRSLSLACQHIVVITEAVSPCLLQLKQSICLLLFVCVRM